jgi:hypothetical protein
VSPLKTSFVPISCFEELSDAIFSNEAAKGDHHMGLARNDLVGLRQSLFND